MELRMTEPIWIRDLRAEPSPDTRSVSVTADVVNQTAWSGAAVLIWLAKMAGHGKKKAILPLTTRTMLKQGATTLRAKIKIPAGVPCLDEFNTVAGYAPMDKAEWLRLLGISKSYGIQ
jgi:hypothetical protein